MVAHRLCCVCVRVNCAVKFLRLQPSANAAALYRIWPLPLPYHLTEARFSFSPGAPKPPTDVTHEAETGLKNGSVISSVTGR